jgi:hypothetical protein
MVEVVVAKPGTASVTMPGGAAVGGFLHYLLPGLMVVACVLATTLTAVRVGDLRYWSEIHDGRGQYQVRSCTADTGLGADVWRCDGALVADGSSTDVRSDLVTSLGAFASRRPYVGQQIDVFFDETELGTVYPLQSRLNELARLYLSLLPRVLVLVGAAMWLVGWHLTRNLDPSDLVARDSIRFPQRFAWQARGLRWMAAAVGFLVVNHLLATRVIGSLGTF